jgi:superfamily II DNA or RNA helicase
VHEKSSKSGSELFIVDNSDVDWKVLRYLHDWCDFSKSIDIATGNFEIGSLLALKDAWQKVDHIRILMGDETSLRTKQAFEQGLIRAKDRLDKSIEGEKEKDDFLNGLPAIVDALRKSKITCRVYRKEKFHAKAYITHARSEVIGSFALVGSSNFTFPGLTENVELNVQITGRQVGALQEWYDRYWNEAEDVTPEMLRVIERHVREYSPFEVYAKALHDLFCHKELPVSEWENTQSQMYPVLDKYQKDGYHSLLEIANRYGGALLCDGVGLGKTFVGLMLIERLIRDGKNVVLLVPKSARKPVWERDLNKYIKNIHNYKGDLSIYNHTDLQRGGEFPAQFERLKFKYDAIVIDEAHHFRNPGIKGEGERNPSRYRQLFDIIEGPNGNKQVFMLTATPVNNNLFDFLHMIELFSRKQDDNFSGTLGIHSLRGHFIKMEKALEKKVGREPGEISETDLAEAGRVLYGDSLFKALVVQRSRAYVKDSQIQQGASIACFPKREPPKIAEYSLKIIYGRLLDMIDAAFKKDKPLFSLAVYYPLAYYKGDDNKIDPLSENRQKQVVGLIRTQFLKRFESSVYAFQQSCERIFFKLLEFVRDYSETAPEKRILERWTAQNEKVINIVEEHQREFIEELKKDEVDDDIENEEITEEDERLSRDEYRVEEILQETFLDLDELVKFLDELRNFKPRNDDKLKSLVKLLKNDPVLSKNKALVFTEFADTARYLYEQMKNDIGGLDVVDSSDKRDRGDVIMAFAPYYNGSSSATLTEKGVKETRVLISTDVLSEGLNLQDATRLINYDIHWNPVRLMQRIGRVDRRLNPETEEAILKDHPEQKKLRGNIEYYNFLPPSELDDLLKLYGRVAHKTLRISKTFGVEGKKLLRPEDDYDTLKEFNSDYEGSESAEEIMHLEYNQILKDNPGLEENLKKIPLRVFSGKKHPNPDSRAVFFCYALPERKFGREKQESEWSVDGSRVQWYLFDLNAEKIIENPAEIVDFIRSAPDTPRQCSMERKTLSEIRARVDKHIKDTYLKRLNVPLKINPILKAWMELN